MGLVAFSEEGAPNGAPNAASKKSHARTEQEGGHAQVMKTALSRSQNQPAS